MNWAAARQRAPTLLEPSTWRQNAATITAVHAAGIAASATSRSSEAQGATLKAAATVSSHTLYGTCPANHRSSARGSAARRARADAMNAAPTTIWISTTNPNDRMDEQTNPPV